MFDSLSENLTRTLRGDPAHKIVNPQLYRYEEALACWREVVAPVLWVEGAHSETAKRLKIDPAVAWKKLSNLRAGADLADRRIT